MAGLTVLEGWLHRSRKGDSTTQTRRYFVSSGFAVEYRMTADPATKTGQFDLRRVTSLDESEPGRLTFLVRGKREPLHVFLNVAEDGADADAWRKLWASGVNENVLSLALEPSRVAAIVDGFQNPSARLERQMTKALLKVETRLDLLRAERKLLQSPSTLQAEPPATAVGPPTAEPLGEPATSASSPLPSDAERPAGDAESFKAPLNAAVLGDAADSQDCSPKEPDQEDRAAAPTTEKGAGPETENSTQLSQPTGWRGGLEIGGRQSVTAPTPMHTPSEDDLEAELRRPSVELVDDTVGGESASSVPVYSEDQLLAELGLGEADGRYTGEDKDEDDESDEEDQGGADAVGLSELQYVAHQVPGSVVVL